MDAASITILALAAILAFLPGLIDRWALQRGASPETLIGLAIVTLAGVAAVPVAFVICASRPAAARGASTATGIVAVAGLLLVAVAAGRTLARAILIRRHWRALAAIAATLSPQDRGSEVSVLPVGELLAFASGSKTFLSQGLVDRLSPAERLAVIEHERAHNRHAHGRLLVAARALTHGAFGLAPARRASAIIDRELDVLADRAAARRLDDPRAVQSALQSIATATAQPGSPTQDIVARRLRDLEPAATPTGRLADGAVRLATVTIGTAVATAICLSIHATSIWLGIGACALLVASLYAFTRPVIAPRIPVTSWPAPRAGDTHAAASQGRSEPDAGQYRSLASCLDGESDRPTARGL
jgi:Zn-dependent protease with chaperone function